MRVTYIDHMGDSLRPVNAAKVSYNRQADMLGEKEIHLLERLASSHHDGVFEHCFLTVAIECPLFIRSQIHRHRGSYNEVSRRYTAEKIQFYIPQIEHVRFQSTKDKQVGQGQMSEQDAEKFVRGVIQSCLVGYLKDKEGMAMGSAREIARGNMSQWLMTKFWMSGNLRFFMHYLGLRLDKHAQFEHRIIAKMIEYIILNNFGVSASILKKYNCPECTVLGKYYSQFETDAKSVSQATLFSELLTKHVEEAHHDPEVEQAVSVMLAAR